MMTIDWNLNEAETIYKLALARESDFDLAVYMAMRLEERSKEGAEYLKFMIKNKTQFKRVFLISDFLLKKWLQLSVDKTHSPIL